MCVHGTETGVDLPDWVHPEKENRTVALDSCIADSIQTLWAAGIDTLGCCCGHGRDRPDVVVPSSMSATEVNRAVGVLQSDGRAWSIKQWKLVEVGTTKGQTIANDLAQHTATEGEDNNADIP